MKDKMEKFQSILMTIRFILKISVREFGSMVGLTGQAISNYEHGSSKIPKMFYISTRIILDRINDPMVNDLIEVVVDHPEKYDDAENIAFTIDLFAKAIHCGTDRKVLSYSKMEYEKTDWLEECISMKH